MDPPGQDPFIEFSINEESTLIEYEWLVKPGGDPATIFLEDINHKQPLGPEIWYYVDPIAYQLNNGAGAAIEIEKISLDNQQIGFNIENYNRDQELFISLYAETCPAGFGQKINTSLYFSSDTAGNTYYVRTDGGTGSQCDGTVDAAYPGTGSNQPCAWAHPFWALDGDGNWKIAGGDTIIIGPGSYMIGFGAPNTGWCDIDGTFVCHLPPLPSGPDSNNPTRILGAGWNSGCTSPPELWGTQRTYYILNMNGTDNAYVGCLEITDHSSCVEFHSNAPVECKRDEHPYGDWAHNGLWAEDSANVTLKDLNIHGLGEHGVWAGRLSDWHVEDVRIAGNGWAGWDGDVDGTDSNSGRLYFKNFQVEWNGCGETWPGEQPHNCWGQSAGGYGDGVGTGHTSGHWIIEDSTIRYNTSDGLDLLYVRETGSKIEIKRSQAYGNAGDQIKTSGPVRIENSLMVSNCGYFDGKSFTYNVDNCRSGGSAFASDVRQGNTVSVINSTIAGQGDCLAIVECQDSSCNGSEKLIIQNNIFIGYQQFDTTDTTCYFWFDQDNFYDTRMDYNIIYNLKMGDLNYSANDLNQDPLVVSDTLSTFDGHLTLNSPAINSGLPVGSLDGLIPNHDINWGIRPTGSGVDRGVYEYGSTTMKKKDDLLGTWDGQGVYYRHSGTGTWIPLATPATQVTCGDLGTDGIDDLLGIWPEQGGVWRKDSSNGGWSRLSTTADRIAAGDMNGDGRADLVGTWTGQGVYYRDTATGNWVSMATPASQVACGDLDGDNRADLIGTWSDQGGVWAKYSSTSQWGYLATMASWIACGDMNGDGRADLLGSWSGQGVYYRDTATGNWVGMATPASQVACGDLDGDGKKDLIGSWPGQGGVWVKYSYSNQWDLRATTAAWIAAGRMHNGSGPGSIRARSLSGPYGGDVRGPNTFESFEDMWTFGPRGINFKFRNQVNIQVGSAIDRIQLEKSKPGPGMPGFSPRRVTEKEEERKIK